jgi:hypothetical protein
MDDGVDGMSFVGLAFCWDLSQLMTKPSLSANGICLHPDAKLVIYPKDSCDKDASHHHFLVSFKTHLNLEASLMR